MLGLGLRCRVGEPVGRLRPGMAPPPSPRAPGGTTRSTPASRRRTSEAVAAAAPSPESGHDLRHRPPSVGEPEERVLPVGNGEQRPGQDRRIHDQDRVGRGRGRIVRAHFFASDRASARVWRRPWILAELPRRLLAARVGAERGPEELLGPVGVPVVAGHRPGDEEGPGASRVLHGLLEVAPRLLPVGRASRRQRSPRRARRGGRGSGRCGPRTRGRGGPGRGPRRAAPPRPSGSRPAPPRRPPRSRPGPRTPFGPGTRCAGSGRRGRRRPR